MTKKKKSKNSQIFASSALETMRVGYELGLELSAGAVVFLEGDLGAGKSTFVKGFCQSRGIDESEVNSPTFTYLHLHQEIAHFDLYRLENLEQFLGMGFDEYLEEPYIACIEWPGILEGLQLKQVIRVRLEHNEGNRMITIERNYETD